MTIAWVVMGPEPHLASCLRCGGTVPKPELPMSLKAFATYIKRAADQHAKCVEAPVRVTAEARR